MTAKAPFKPTLCVDFDGVIHSYESGWKGEAVIPDPPVPGALAWLEEACHHFEVCIYSSRSKHPEGVLAMFRWLEKHLSDPSGSCPSWITQLQFPTQKPAAWLTIDDRAICFNGTFPSIEEMRAFQPWNKRKETSAMMGIGRALEAMRDGKRVTRAGWNGANQWLELQRPDLNSKMTLPYVYITTVQGHRVPWVCSQNDLLASDWEVVP